MNYEEVLNKEQYEAVTATEDRLLFLAGAGTGKTHTMMYRTAYLVENGVDPRNILLLTFTNKAAHEMVERLEKMEVKGITACTFHSFCVKMLRRYSRFISIDNSFTVLSQSDQEESINMHRPKKFPLTAGQLTSLESYAINKKLKLLPAIAENCGDEYTDLEPDIRKILTESINYRRIHNMLTYDDLLLRFIALLKTTNLNSLLRKRYTHIMVDEYQDTNSLQDEILDLIDPMNLAVVGDDCQSLYAFRGAEVGNIISFPEKHNSRVIKIEQNYRSNQAILDVSNQMMSSYSQEGIPKWLTAVNDYGDEPQLYRPYSCMEEAVYVAEYIKDWITENDPAQLCVIVRTARASNFLESRLTAEKIPFEKRGGPKFFESKHIREILALFELTINKKNQLAWYRALSLLRNIGDAYSRKLADILSMGEDLSKYKSRTFYSDLEEMLKVLDDDSEWHERLSNMINYYLDLRIRNLGASNKKDKEELLLATKTVIKADLDILTQVADSFDTAEEFIDDLMTSNVPSLEEGEGIVISTIHSAKGLEFDTVIMMGVSEGVFPREYSDEELRCMYVALTRAKEHLLITSPRYYRKGKNNDYCDVPIYIKGLVKEIGTQSDNVVF